MDEISTRDLYLAATLLSYGSQIISIDRKDLKRQHFFFDKIPQQVTVIDGNGLPYQIEVSSLSEIEFQFISKKLFLPPTFIDCLKSMKAYLHSGVNHVQS